MGDRKRRSIAEPAPGEVHNSDLVLTKDEEAAFQDAMRNGDGYRQWRERFIQEHGEEPDLNNSDYNYREAWKNGVVPAPYENDQGRYHWASSTPDGAMLKHADHPTAWMERFMRETGDDPLSIGVNDPASADKYLNNKWNVSIGDAQMVPDQTWNVDVGDPEMIPAQEFDPASETANPWQVDIGDAQLDPSIEVNVGEADMLGPNEFFTGDGSVGSWNFGKPEMRSGR